MQRTRPRIVPVLAGVGMTALMVTGCSTGGGGGETDSKTLTFASGQEAAVQPLIDAFEKANPGITVDAEFIEADDAYIQQLRTKLSAGTAPDVFKVWPGGGDAGATWTLGSDGMLADLSDRPWAKEVPDSLIAVSSVDGALFSLPANTGGIGAIYNDQALEEVGAAIPTKWSEVLELCATATSAGKVAFVLGNKDAWTAQMIPYALTASLVYGPDPDFLDQQLDGTTSFSDSAWREALDKVDEMKAAGCFNEGPNGTGFDEQMRMLGFGEALAAVQVSQAVPAGETLSPGTTFTLSPLPASDDPAETYVPVAAGVSFAVNAKAKNKELAEKFIDFVASPEGQTLFAESSGSSPGLTASDDLELSPLLESIAALQAEGRGTPYPDQLWPNTQVKDAYLTGIQEFYGDTITGADLLTRMDEAILSD